MEREEIPEEIDLATMVPEEGIPSEIDIDPRLSDMNDLERKRFMYRKYKQDWIKKNPDAYKQANHIYCRRYYANNRDKVKSQARKHYWEKQSKQLDDQISLLQTEIDYLAKRHK